MDKLQQISSSKSHGGYQKVYSHQSKVLQCEMKFAAYFPPDVDMKPHPVIYWLSGLTCNEQNFITKSGVQKYAAEHNLVIICPDTSPRNVNVPGEDDSYDFGSGAGFYVDATEEPWKNNYQMYSYITKELPELVNNAFPVDPDRQSIMGHSMGGHGALVCYLRNPGKYRCVSAFAPICNPTRCPWGRKALSGYLGGTIEGNHVPDSWMQYDATCLVSNFDGPPVDILIDQGGADEFLKAGQLLPENFVKACQQAQVPVILNSREGYDHSYYYIASFVEDHIKHHLKYLNQ